MERKNDDIYEQARRAVQQPCPVCQKMELEFLLRCDPASSTCLTVLRCRSCKTIHAMTALDATRRAS
ncbi:MAG: hypothetical protein ISR76_07655 [Planctomycetes bacterium]|nr:hypothetical protein [Planctomycetota bacterium]MBL7008859.1 hypothetical protein [Planctomycetota bacterium]